MKTVEVFLSTYNGEEFLEEQIESLINQSEVNITISIRDDGSTDSTVSILKKYENNTNINVIYGENIGYQNSFFELIKNSSNASEYYAFSDQDDVWEQRKLIEAIESIESLDSSDKHKLYFSNLKVVDSNLRVLGLKKFNDRKISFGSALSRTNIAGCTMVFNLKLLDYVQTKLNMIDKISIGHDSWIYIICLLIDGEIIYDDSSYIYFRRHSSTTSDLNKGILYKIKKLMKELYKDKNRSWNLSNLLIEVFLNDISTYKLNLLLDIKNYKNSFNNFQTLLFNKELLTGNKMVDYYIRLRILLGVY